MTLDRSIHDSRKPPAGPAGRPRTAYRYEKSVVSSASQAVTPLDEPTTSLGYGTPVAVRRGPVRTRPVRRRGLSRNDGQHAGHDALYGPPSALVGFFTPSDSSHDRALLYLYCISPGPPPPVGPPERAAAGSARGPARSGAVSSPRLLAYTVTTVVGTPAPYTNWISHTYPHHLIFELSAKRPRPSP